VSTKSEIHKIKPSVIRVRSLEDEIVVNVFGHQLLAHGGPLIVRFYCDHFDVSLEASSNGGPNPNGLQQVCFPARKLFSNGFLGRPVMGVDCRVEGSCAGIFIRPWKRISFEFV
jgi:hypothetical protein